MNLSVKDFSIIIMMSMSFSYVVIYGIIYAKSMESRLVFLCFVLIFTLLLWLKFNPYMKVFYATLTLWSGWSAAPILSVIADYLEIKIIGDFLRNVSGVPAVAHVAIACVAIAALAFHYLDQRASDEKASGEAKRAAGVNPPFIEIVIQFANGIRSMTRNRDRTAILLFFIMASFSIVMFSIIFYAQRTVKLPEISDDLIVLSIAITSATVAGEVARQYQNSYHHLVNALLSFFVVAIIGGVCALAINLIENRILSQACHEYNYFKIIQGTLCMPIAFFGAQLGAKVGLHPDIENILLNPGRHGSVWQRLLVGEFAWETNLLSLLLFVAFICGFFSEVSYGATHC